MLKLIKYILNINILIILFSNYSYASGINSIDKKCQPNEIIDLYKLDASIIWIYQKSIKIDDDFEYHFDVNLYKNKEKDIKIIFQACSYNYCSSVSTMKYKINDDITDTVSTILYVNYFHPAIDGDAQSYQPDGEAVFAIKNNKVCYIYKNGRNDFNSAIDDTKQTIKSVLEKRQ